MNVNEKFFVTCGRGLETFALRELSSVPTVFNLQRVDGKVYFDVVNCSLHTILEHLLQLKSVERVFLCVFLSIHRTSNVSSPLRQVVQECLEHFQGKKFQHSVQVWSACNHLNDPHESVVATFRVSSKCAGRAARRYTPPKLSKLIGAAIKRNTSWTTNLRNPHLEVYVHLNDESFFVGFPLAQRPLSKRPYIKVIALRSTVCWAMASLANIKLGDRVLDPMCGAGTILIETVKSWPLVGCLVGVDIDCDQLRVSVDNLAYSGSHPTISLVQGNVQSLPFADRTFDAVLCDFPFGLKHGTMKEATDLLPNAVSEIDRVCRIGGHVVFLVSPCLAVCLQEAVSSRRSSNHARQPSLALPRSLCLGSASTTRTDNVDVGVCSTWKRLSKYDLNLGELEACIVTYIKKY